MSTAETTGFAVGGRVPEGFLWGAATAPHQVEGNNTASDIWALENMPGSPMAERSGDACDSLHRWPEDLDVVAGLGLNSYRFGVEWARIEPEEGRASAAMLAYYRRIIEGCLERGLTPVVTLHHFTSPKWFSAAGGWTAPEAVDRWRRYVRAVRTILTGVEWVCTINEPNILAMITAIRANKESPSGANLVAGAMPPPDNAVSHALAAAHRAAREELVGVPGLRVGWTVANQNFEALPGAEELAAEWAWPREDFFLDAARGDDFIGVQSYTRTLLGPGGPVEPPESAVRTQTGWEYYPQGLESAVRHTAERTGGVPILVTENGIATDDDPRRSDYIRRALTGLGRAVADGVDVRGYLHWSLLDNYEWGSWTPTFGLAAVDRTTFERAVKPSAVEYGGMARAGVWPREQAEQPEPPGQPG